MEGEEGKVVASEAGVSAEYERSGLSSRPLGSWSGAQERQDRNPDPGEKQWPASARAGFPGGQV